MRKHISIPYLILIVCSLFAGTQRIFAQADDWKPISEAELTAKSPKIEPSADAEAIFWEIKIDDSPATTTIWRHYLRVRIFTERGREKFSKVSVLVPENGKVENVRARVIKPDGSVVEIKKQDIFEQEIVKTRFSTVKAVSFAVPNLEVGSIFEYKYDEASLKLAIGDKPLIFQRDIPVQKITYIIKPLAGAEIAKTFMNMSEPAIRTDSQGFFHFSQENVPAVKAEPLMPPEKEVVRWMFVSNFSKFFKMDPAKFWETTAGELSAGYKLKYILKPNDKLKAKAREIVGDASTDEEKLKRLFEFCQTRINNLDFSALSFEDRTKIQLKLNTIPFAESPHNTLKTAQGFSLQVNELFAALAASYGFEARYAFTGDRREFFFTPKYKSRRFIHFAAIAVKLRGKWTYFDPAEPNLEFGMLDPAEENQASLLSAETVFSWDQTPLSSAARSKIKRTGKFKLDEPKSLAGEIRIEYSGHPNFLLKNFFRLKTATERESFIKNEAKALNGSAEIEDINIENLAARENLVVSYKIRVPDYAQTTGSRLFFQPGFFENGTQPELVSEQRTYPVSFDFPFSQEDEIEIEIPRNFLVEAFESPLSVNDPRKNLSDTINVSTISDGKIKYTRKFVFGVQNKILYQPDEYGELKRLLDEVNRIDNLSISLKQK